MPSTPVDRVLALDATYETIASAVTRAFEELLPRLEGKSVLLKPNMLLGWPAEWGATTHPALVRACVEEVTRRGGRPMVGDTPSAGYLTRSAAVARKTGILEAAADAFVPLDAEVAHRALSSTGEVVPICRAVLEADLLVTLPKLKTHALTFMTGGVKNSYGHVAGGAKSRLHKVAPAAKAFAGAVVDVFEVRPADLVITDAVTVMQGNGPSTRDLRAAGKLLASRNAVAADVAGCRLMGLDPETVPTLVEASARGLGPARLGDVSVEGDGVDPIAGFKLPTTYRLGRLTDVGTALASSTLFDPMSRPKLELRQGRCTGCGTCVDGCPTGALTMTGRRTSRRGRARSRSAPLPALDRQLCISCFCCMEQCPEEAWELSKMTRALGEVERVFNEGLGALLRRR